MSPFSIGERIQHLMLNDHAERTKMLQVEDAMLNSEFHLCQFAEERCLSPVEHLNRDAAVLLALATRRW